LTIFIGDQHRRYECITQWCRSAVTVTRSSTIADGPCNALVIRNLATMKHFMRKKACKYTQVIVISAKWHDKRYDTTKSQMNASRRYAHLFSVVNYPHPPSMRDRTTDDRESLRLAALEHSLQTSPRNWMLGYTATRPIQLTPCPPRWTNCHGYHSVIRQTTRTDSEEERRRLSQATDSQSLETTSAAI